MIYVSWKVTRWLMELLLLWIHLLLLWLLLQRLFVLLLMKTKLGISLLLLVIFILRNRHRVYVFLKLLLDTSVAVKIKRRIIVDVLIIFIRVIMFVETISWISISVVWSSMNAIIVLVLLNNTLIAAFVQIILIVNFIIVSISPLIIWNSTNWRVFMWYRIIQWSPLVYLGLLISISLWSLH